MAQRILVVDDSPINLKAVTLALTAAGYEVIVANNGREGLEQALSAQPDMVILDVQMPDLDGYEVCRRLRSTPAFSVRPIMMLTANNSLQERVKGLESGADDYVSKPFEPEELQARVRALMRRAAASALDTVEAQGKVIALFSLRGGAGISTLATNLACGLSQIWGDRSALVDLVFTGGHSALMLNLPLRSTWGDLARQNTENIDGELLEQVLLTHNSGVHVLASAPRPEQNELITADKVTHVLSMLRNRFKYIILDLPHDFRETSLAALDAADQILLVLAPEIGSMSTTICALDVFDQLGYDPNKLSLVLNATFERGALARKEIESTLKRPLSMIIPFAGELFVQALNRGVPPILEMPTKPLGTLLEDWSFSLSTEEDRKRPQANPSAALRRIGQRFQQRRGVRA